MFKVEFWSEICGRYLVKKFDDYKEASAFAVRTHGILSMW